MADSISDADKVSLALHLSSLFPNSRQIRNKRLAKLGISSQAQAPTQEGESSAQSLPKEPTASTPAEQPSTKPRINITSSRPPQEAARNPFSQLGLRSTNQDGTSDSTPSTTPAQSSLKRSHPSESTVVAAPESLEDWEDRTLSAIFRISLDPDKRQDHLGHKLYYAEGVKQELEEQDAPLQLNFTVLEQAILEAGSITGRSSPFTYMLGCWKRISKQLRALKSKPDESKLNIVREARRICMSYCIFAVTMADSMFGRETPSSSPLKDALLQDSEDEQGLCHDFLQEISSRFAEDETAKEAIVWAVEDLSRDLAKMTMNDDYKPHVMVS